MTKKHSDAETSKFEEKVKKLEKTNEHLLAQNVKGTKTNQTLLASEEKYQSLIESSDDPIYLVDRELKYLYANKKLLSRYGKSLSEVTGQSYANFHSPEATELFSNRVKEVLKSGKPVAYEYKSQRDGKDFLRTLNPFVNRKTGEIAAITVISKDITKQKQSEERIKHLNRILLAVRNVNQLITKENDRGSLIEKACGLLVETRGYLDVWIAILDEKGKMTKYANAGNSEYISKISEILKSGKITPCGIESLKHSEITITKPGQPICSGCPVFDYDIDKGVMTIPLKYENKIYGVAAATVPAEMLTDEEEQSLFTEVTSDIAFALWKMEMEEEKHKLEEIESSILHSVPFAVIGLHKRQITFANESVKDVFGWDAAELIGKNNRILYRSDEEYEKIADLFYPVLEKQQTHSEEFPCRRKDGKDIICMVSAARIGENLKDREIVVTYADITEHKKAEKALRESEKKYHSLAESSEDPIYILDERLNFLYANKKLQERYGKPLDEIIGENYSKFHSPEKSEKFSEKVRGVFKTCKPIYYEHKSERDYKYFMRTLSPIINPDTGKVMAVTAISKDITQLKLSENKLEKIHRIYADAIENANGIPYLLNYETGTYEFMGEACEKVLGIPKNKMNHERMKSIVKKVIPTYPGATEIEYDRAFKAGKIDRYRADILIETPSDEEKWLSDHAVPIKDEKTGIVRGSLGILQDITERKHAEEALRDSEENFKNIFHFVPESLLAVNDKIEVLNSNKAFEKLICKYAPELDMSEKELRKKIISELRKRFGKTNHGLIEIRKTAEK